MEHLLIPLVPVDDKFSQGQVLPGCTNGRLHSVLNPPTYDMELLGLASLRVRDFSPSFLLDSLVYPKKKGGELRGRAFIILQLKDSRHIKYHL